MSGMKTLAYFVFGKKKEYQFELSFSVLSAVRYLVQDPAPIRIVLITEEGAGRPDLPIEHLFFSRDEFSRWSGGSGNVHRVKEFALMKALDHYRGAVAHIDPDTYFLQHPRKLFERISPRNSVMHASEGPLSSHLIWEPILGSGVTEVAGYPVLPESLMLNSGVIGLDYSDRDLLLDSVLVEDRLYEISPAFNIEQFATGAVLSKRTRLSLCNDILKHYWGHERHFINAQCAELFPSFTAENFNSLIAAKSLPMVGYPKKSLIHRLAARALVRLRGGDRDYGFAYLAYRSALACAGRKPTEANIWARIALDSLRYSSYGLNKCESGHQRVVRRDFRLFNQEAIDGAKWLNPDVKRAWVNYWS